MIAKDHLGNLYPTLTAMAKAYNISPACFIKRLDRGFSIEQALTTKVRVKTKDCTDHLGNKYHSYQEMITAYNIDFNVFNRRRRLGWDIERILTTPPSKERGSGKECTDHLGNTYKSIKELCRAYKLSDLNFFGRRKMGWSIKKILTTPIRPMRKVN